MKVQSVAVLSAAVAGAVAVVLTPVAGAEPPKFPCNNFEFRGAFKIAGDNNTRIEVDLAGNPAYGRAKYSNIFYLGESGNVAARIDGRNLTLEAVGSGPAEGPRTYVGTIDDNGIAAGSAHLTNTLAPVGSWRAETPLACIRKIGRADPPDAVQVPVADKKQVAAVTSDVDVYDKPDGVGTPYDGIFLENGRTLELVEPCRDSWCHLVIPEVPGGRGWVYQDGFLNVT